MVFNGFLYYKMGIVLKEAEISGEKEQKMMNRKYVGYARVSTQIQKEDRQIIALMEYGVLKSCIFVDKQSGRDFERKNYKRMLKKLNKGNILVVKSIDRLGRNYDEILKQWRYITKDIDADIVVLDMELLDTRQHKNLLGTFVSDMVLQILGFVAESERENIRQRQTEGIAAAKARGVKFGRPKKFIADNYTVIHNLYRQKKISKKEAKRRIGCGESTFLTLMRELEAQHR